MRDGLFALALTILVASAPAQAAPSPSEDTFTTLGTMGGPVPAPDRSQPAIALLHSGGVYPVRVHWLRATLTKANGLGIFPSTQVANVPKNGSEVITIHKFRQPVRTDCLLCDGRVGDSGVGNVKD